MTEYATIAPQGGLPYKIRILKISEQELNDTWDMLETKLGPLDFHSPWCGRPSEYLLQAYRLKLITWEVAQELYMASIGLGCTDP